MGWKSHCKKNGFYIESVGHLGRVMNPVARPIPIQDNTNIEETQTFMPRVEFETMTLVSERVKIFHSLDRSANAIGF
jgi:hypothetical protein